MHLDSITAPLAQLLRLAAMALAIAAGLRLAGFVSLRASATELAAVAIAAALAAR